MNAHEAWFRARRTARVCAALVRHGFDAVCAPDAAKATALVMAYVKPGMKVGLGGSMTIAAMGLGEQIRQAGAILLDHNKIGLSNEERMEVRRAQLTCDLFISSTNAVSIDGELYNVDGSGNRLAALAFGPRKTIVVAGANKIVENEQEAWARIKSRAAPLNNYRLERPNPCVQSGHCMDCQTAARICNIYQVLRRKPLASDFTVILVAEDLGY